MNHLRVSSFLLLIAALISCGISTTEENEANSNPENQTLNSNALKIENGFRRGIGFSDSTGAEFNLRYIPITLSSDTSIPIKVILDFQSEYVHEPRPGLEEKFRLVALPEKWALDGIGVDEEMLSLLPAQIAKAGMIIELLPGDSYLLAIGSIYDKNPVCGIIPSELFVIDKGKLSDDCMNDLSSSHTKGAQINLGLKLDYCSDGCTLISCGSVSP